MWIRPTKNTLSEKAWEINNYKPCLYINIGFLYTLSVRNDRPWAEATPYWAVLFLENNQITGFCVCEFDSEIPTHFEECLRNSTSSKSSWFIPGERLLCSSARTIITGTLGGPWSERGGSDWEKNDPWREPYDFLSRIRSQITVQFHRAVVSKTR